jgi:hypothetical protein
MGGLFGTSLLHYLLQVEAVSLFNIFKRWSSQLRFASGQNYGRIVYSIASYPRNKSLNGVH